MCSEPKLPHRSTVPSNPGLKVLVADKRQWAEPIDPSDSELGFLGWHERGYLPHRDEPGLVQFVTFRLADTFPETLRSEWEYLWSIEDNRERRQRLEQYLDLGRGECHLKDPEIARIVENSIRLFDGTRYELRAWVLMGNHVHVLFKTLDVPMCRLVESWKKHTASCINRWMNRTGRFWAAGYFDTYMRDEAHEKAVVRYIENNPAKAKLVLDPKAWQWGSARFRDEYGILRVGSPST